MFLSAKNNVKNNYNVTELMNNIPSCVPFKRFLFFEQTVSKAVITGDSSLLNIKTHELVFCSSPKEKGIVSNFIDKKIQMLPKNMHYLRKNFNASTFFDDFPNLNISVNRNNYSSVQALNQRTSHIYEILGAEAMKRKYGETYVLTNGVIKYPSLALKHTNQKNSDYFCIKTFGNNGNMYSYFYYSDMKVTDKIHFLKKISVLHPNKLMLCQTYIVGDLTESFIFNSATKKKLVTGCADYMQQQVNDGTPLAFYEKQLMHELSVFNNNPTVENYNALCVSPWRIFTVPNLIKIFI